MEPHWAVKYVGKPYMVGAAGPNEFDCWGLVWWIQSHEFGAELPRFPVEEYPEPGTVDPLWDSRVSSAKAQLVNWIETTTPVEGDIVLMNNGHHVGVYLEADGGLILHTRQSSSAIAQPLSVLRKLLRCRDVQFYHYYGQRLPRL